MSSCRAKQQMDTAVAKAQAQVNEIYVTHLNVLKCECIDWQANHWEKWTREDVERAVGDYVTSVVEKEDSEYLKAMLKKLTSADTIQVSIRQCVRGMEQAKQHRDMRQKAEELRKQNEELMAKASSHQGKLEELQKELAAARRKRQEMETEADRYMQEMKQMQTKARAQRAQYQDRIVELRRPAWKRGADWLKQKSKACSIM